MNTLLHEILAAREQRCQKQQELLRRFKLPLVCFTMNIPGPTKDSPLIRRAFATGLSMLDEKLGSVRFREVAYANTGSEAFYVPQMDAAELKKLCTAIEESCPLGRLFDMDVLDTNGEKLERKNQRGCMVCGKPGRFCAASRAHDVATLQQTTSDMITAHFAAADGEFVADLAVQALLAEVHATPKPGLVDENNQGSHKDMDIPLFTKSAHVLRPYFLKCFEIGRQTPEDTFCLLRSAGMEAEQQMFAATKGVNTHKGAIYTLGLLCGSIGRLWQADAPFAGADAILREVSKLATIDDLLSMDTPKTAGEALYVKYGLTGIRGEAAAGFPSIATIALPAYRQALTKGKTENDAAVTALIHLIAHVADTNLYHRGGAEGAAYAKSAAAALLPEPTNEALLELDKAFIQKNLSPGGCADLLAATIFLHKLTHKEC